MLSMTPWTRFARNFGLLILGSVVFWFVGQQAVRADHIDDELIKRAPELVKALQAKGYKNVGVLKFMVKAGKESANANIGPMNLVMAQRVENALIHGLDTDHPLGVIKNATQVAAAANPKFTTQSEAGRKALFKSTYPLAWGTDKVHPDALLTGTVALAPGMRKATVEIDSFDSSGAKPQRIMHFEVETDRSILADSGRSYVLKTRGLKKKRSLEELDDDAADSAASSSEGKSVTQQAGSEIPIKFEIRYNNNVQTISQDPGSLGEMKVDEPKAGDEVSFQITNTTSAKIGVVVKVNGESTLGQDTAEDAACQKWILEPNKPYALKGFYTYPENKVAKFKVLSDEDSAARMAEWAGSRPRAGYIDVTVFTSGVASEDLTFGRTLRSLGPSHGKHPHPKTAAQARSLVDEHTKSHSTKAKKRGLVVASDQKEDAHLTEDSLDNMTATFQLQINYYKPIASGI